MEKLIADKEEEVKELNQQLCLEEVYSNPARSQEVHHKITELESEIEALYEEWEEIV